MIETMNRRRSSNGDIAKEEVSALLHENDVETEQDIIDIDLDEDERSLEMTSLDKRLKDIETDKASASPAIGVALDMDSELKSLIEECDDEEQAKCIECVNNSNSTLENPGSFCGCGCYKMGSCFVLFPRLYRKTSMGIIGPHFLGVIFTFVLLSSLSFFYIVQANNIGPITTAIASVFATSCFYNLLLVTTSDPGFIHAKGTRKECRRYLSLDTASASHAKNEDGNSDDEDCPSVNETATFRYCGLCNVYQPSNARHCQDCGMCVVGYDHHCPWMGTCIGKFNMKAFVRFNFSWLLWLLFAVGWISLGSTLLTKHS